MIDPTLFEQPQALDRVLHRTLRLKADAICYERTAGMNALFVTAVEFGDVCREYPIVFVDAGAGPDGRRDVAPMAVLGLEKGENLMLGAYRRQARRNIGPNLDFVFTTFPVLAARRKTSERVSGTAPPMVLAWHWPTAFWGSS